MKVRTRKTHILRTLARELWLTPQRKQAAKVIVAQFDNNLKMGKCQKITVDEFFATLGIK